MIRFFVRLANAALADWLTWQISTPQMRFERKTRKHRRQIKLVLEAVIPVVQDLGEATRRTSEAFVRFAQRQAEERRDV